MRILCLYFTKPQNTQALAEIFYAATPQVMIRDQSALFLEIEKCTSLYSEQTFLRRTYATLKKLALSAKIGLADDICTALALATTGAKLKDQLPIGALRSYADPLGDKPEINQMTNRMVDHLQSLGVYTFKDFLKIPIKEISSRFGSIGFLVYLRIQGQSDVMWRDALRDMSGRENPTASPVTACTDPSASPALRRFSTFKTSLNTVTP